MTPHQSPESVCQNAIPLPGETFSRVRVALGLKFTLAIGYVDGVEFVCAVPPLANQTPVTACHTDPLVIVPSAPLVNRAKLS